MQNTTKKRKPFLLPNYFKKIGFAIFLVALVMGVISKLYNIDYWGMPKHIFKMVVGSGFLIGLSVIASSKEKMEDELTAHIRLKSISNTFVYMVFYVITLPFGNFFSRELETKYASSQVLVASMLIVYLVIFFIRKIER